jgi:hypothetical protein
MGSCSKLPKTPDHYVDFGGEDFESAVVFEVCHPCGIVYAFF